jgi:hypothetical protein
MKAVMTDTVFVKTSDADANEIQFEGNSIWADGAAAQRFQTELQNIKYKTS